MVKNFDTVPFCMSNPYKLRGTKQPISFGVEKLDGYIVDATEETIEGEELEVEDENNNVVAHFSGFGSLSEVFERSNIARESIQGALSVVSESLLSQSSGTATKSVKYERNAVNPRLYEWNFISRCGRFRFFKISSAEQIITAISKSWREISASSPFIRRIIGEFTASK